MIYTIDMLLAELGQMLPLGNGERYRIPLVRHVKYVLGRVGYKKTANVYTKPFEVSGGVIDPLPDYVLDVLDAGFSQDRMEGEKFGIGYGSSAPLAFDLTPFGIQFRNFESGLVYLKYQSLPVDKTEQVVIAEELYQACMDYAFAKILMGFPAHPMFSQQRIKENDALGMIDQARAALNRKGRLAQNRANRKYNG